MPKDYNQIKAMAVRFSAKSSRRIKWRLVGEENRRMGASRNLHSDRYL